MPINKEIKSNRLLASRRYTHDDIADYQDNFTRVLDLGEEEIYTQAGLIPTASLPLFSTTGQIYSASLGGDPIMKYWSKQQLTPSSRTGANGYKEVWFFLSTPKAETGFTPIDADQETNFISNKYVEPGISAFNAETAGSDRAYNVIAYKNGTSTQIPETDFVFDYKTGVLEFVTNANAAGVSSVYVSAYQYIGRTLKDDLQNGYSGSFSGSFEGSADLNSLTVTGDSTLTGNTDRTGTLIQNGNLTLTGSFNQDGNINQIGDATLTGNTDRTGTLTQDGNLILTGSFLHTGSLNQTGDSTLTGNTDRTGTLIQNGNLTLTGSFNQDGNINQIGDATLTGNTDRTGTLIQDGNLTLTGSFNHSGSYNLIGDINQTGSVFQSGSLDVNGPIFSQGTNVIDNAVALAIALG